MNILIIDDDNNNLEILRYYLSEKHNLKLFKKPYLAFETFKKYLNFSLVITDVVMPILSGDKLIEKIIEITPNQQFVICSGKSEDEMPSCILNYESSIQYLTKPFNQKDLDRVLATTMKRVG
ncbi:MAG: hypothetical protein COA79_23280 [Planctomycetota bacterium]|nr:MAG: hypothetical protein COA79_23280 [Planctomycetota bacterium]